MANNIINDREPTITIIKSKLADLHQKIAAYKTFLDTRYSIDSASKAVTNEANSDGAVRCSNDDSDTSVSIKCLNDLWMTAGSAIPIPIPKPVTPQGTISIPGTEYTFKIDGNQVDMTNVPGMNMGVLKSTMALLVPETGSLTYTGEDSLEDEMRDAIILEINEINTLINNILPMIKTNKAQTDASVLSFLNDFEKMNAEFKALAIELNKPIELEGNYEMTRIKTTANFGHYVLFLICTIFIFGCLIYVFNNPEVGNIDLFILALAVIILAYYLYMYIVMKMRQKK